MKVRIDTLDSGKVRGKRVISTNGFDTFIKIATKKKRERKKNVIRVLV